ncbi:MAG: GPI inositol-deacylase [Deltaproteobacteria bacterium]|nr:GPI inositol-deacylase [Deltaproteobacteria bacterium]
MGLTDFYKPIFPRVKRISNIINDSVDIIKSAIGKREIERITDFEFCKKPVLLIYGFGASRRVMMILEERLRRDNFDVFTINLGGFFEILRTDGIEETASFVNIKVRRLIERYNLPNIAIVGHSEGGIIGRYMIQKLKAYEYTHTLITLASPHRGTPLAYVGLIVTGFLSQNLWQLTPNSSFIRELNSTTFPESVRFCVIYSKDDKLIPYPYSIPEKENISNLYIIELEGIGHNGFLFYKKPYQHILNFLKESPFVCTE